MQEALALTGATLHLNIVNDGEAALSYLHRKTGYEDAARPDLIFLDLNLPRRDGREVLAELKQNEELRRIPVIVLTTSEAERDITRAYDLHANCYVRKPSDFDEFMLVVRECERFWMKIVHLPVQ